MKNYCKIIQFTISCIALTSILFTSCKTTTPTLSEAECIGSGNAGSIRIKAWGYGGNANEAIEQAKRNAIQDVLFKGIKAGSSICPSNPIAPNGLEKKPDYFREFFRDNGTYLRFVSLSGDGSIRAEDRIRVGRQYKIGVFVVLDHQQLTQKMQADGIVPKLTDGF